MKHFIIVFIAGLVTLAIMLAYYRPDILEDIWLWVIGLIGPIIGGIQELIKAVGNYLKKLDTNANQSD